jgi:hypothetical protein
MLFAGWLSDTSAAKQVTGKVRLRHPAPKGASDFGGLMASLKRCPDTNQ